MTSISRLLPFAVALVLAGGGCAVSQNAALDLPAEPPGENVTVPPAGAPPVAAGGEASAGAEMAAPQPSPIAAEPPALKPYYVAYTAGQYAKAQAGSRPVLLYFWASWCPICRAEEPKIRAAVDASAAAIAGFRVDYDKDKDMVKRFGVTYQHTTVILDSQGNESARFTGPVAEAVLSAALSAAAKPK